MSKFDIVKKAFAKIMLNSTLTENMIEDHNINDVVFEYYNVSSKNRSRRLTISK